MRAKELIIAVALISLTWNISAQEETVPPRFPNGRPEVCFRFATPSPSVLRNISAVISIDKVKGDSVYAYANTREFAGFVRLGIPYTEMPAPSMLHHYKMHGLTKGTQTWDAYPTYHSYLQTMQEFAASYPALCTLDTLGRSVNQRLLLSMKLSGKPAVNGPKPEVMQSSTIHGNEPSGTVFMLELIDYLTRNYQKDSLVTRLLDSLDIYINPLVNPDGLYFSSDSDVYGATRENANSVDLNRNFPDPIDGPHPDGNSYQPETQAMMSFYNTHHILISSMYHEGSEVLNYPWDSQQKRHPDEKWFIAISKVYADSAQYYGPPGYFTSITPSGYVDGWDWYLVYGGLQDYSTYFRGDRDITIEINDTKTPPGDQLPIYWNALYRSFLHYFENAFYGLHGTLRDSASLQQLNAKIELPSIDMDSSWVYSTNGTFYRFRAGDTTDLLVTAPGYDSLRLRNVIISDQKQTRLDILMHKSGTQGVELITAGSTIRFYPNPFDAVIKLEMSSNVSLPVHIVVYDVSGRRCLEQTLQSGFMQVDASGLKPGLYLLSVYKGSIPLASGRMVKL